MSDLITHWATFEDCRRLARYDDGIEPIFKELIESQREYARLGAITRGGNRIMPAVLGSARVRQGRELDPGMARKVAFCLGLLVHQACDRVIKQVVLEVTGIDWNDTHHLQQGRTEIIETGQIDTDVIGDISAYYDVHVFRQVYLAGREEPFNRFFLADNGTSAGKALEELIGSLFQRTLLSAHTLIPDPSDYSGWLDRLFDVYQALYVDVGRYVRVFAHPDPVLTERFGVETAFYRADDPAVRAARAIGRGETPDLALLAAAGDVEANAGGYGQVLALGLQYLRHGSAFWRGEIDAIETPNFIRNPVGRW